MPFVADLGLVAIASRLKSLSDQFYATMDEVYRRHGIVIQARWFPVLRLLHDRGPQPVTQIAEAVGQAHPSISELLKRLERDGWVRSTPHETDRRVRRLALTSAAELAVRKAKPIWRALAEELTQQCEAAGLAVPMTLTGLDAIVGGPLADAVTERARRLNADAAEILPFAPELREHFYRLNADWLTRYFYLEEVDHRVLSDPEGEILAGGGAIFFARLSGEVVGTCALMRTGAGEYELTKMAVDPAAQGLGIGRKLLEAAIGAFQQRGGETLFLETNTRLAQAIRLYESMGFVHQSVARPESHYQRANVYMVWEGKDLAG